MVGIYTHFGWVYELEILCMDFLCAQEIVIQMIFIS